MMLGKRLKGRGYWRGVLASGVFLGLTLTTTVAMSAGDIDPEADKILRSMSTYMGSLKAFNVDADIDIEFVNLEGQKLQISSFSSILIERPGNLHVRRQGALDLTMTFDGKALTFYSEDQNAYFQLENPGTVDNVIDAVRNDFGLSAPAADLMYSKPYNGLINGVNSSAYLGTSFVNGVECHYLTFREDEVDWQLWVKVGEKPLPMKYIITTKWITGAPQYSARFRNWNTQPRIKANQFGFSAPKGARKIETISVDATGEPSMGDVQ